MRGIGYYGPQDNTIGGLLGKAYPCIGDKAKYRRAWTELAALRSNGLCPEHPTATKCSIRPSAGAGGYGQTREVKVYRFATDADMYVLDAVAQKEQGQDNLYDRIPWQMHTNGSKPATVYRSDFDIAIGDMWTLYLGDSGPYHRWHQR